VGVVGGRSRRGEDGRWRPNRFGYVNVVEAGKRVLLCRLQHVPAVSQRQTGRMRGLWGMLGERVGALGALDGVARMHACWCHGSGLGSLRKGQGRSGM